MRAPLSWLREYVDLPADVTGRDVAAKLVQAGLEVETVEQLGAGIEGPLVVGQVLAVEELTEFKKPIRWCQVDVGEANGTGEPQNLICGARNFAVGDKVVVVLPGAVLPGGFKISARKTYGKVSEGMICSTAELGMGEDSRGIIVLPPEHEVGTDAIELLELVDEVLDISVNPDRGYCLSLRGLARETATAYRLPLRDPALIDVPPPNAHGPPGRGRRPGRLRPVHRPRGHRRPSGGPLADLAAATAAEGRHATDLVGRGRHQLRDAGTRPAAARLRPLPHRGHDRRAPRPRRREADHPGRRRARPATPLTWSSPTTAARSVWPG